jgi:uncharacterized protein (TIGR03435 family)
MRAESEIPRSFLGAGGWIANDRFDLDAKMESSVMEALQKLSKEDRTLARQQMMQAVLADRFKLVTHRETRELQIYTLVIGESGLKMKEAKPGHRIPAKAEVRVQCRCRRILARYQYSRRCRNNWD